MKFKQIIFLLVIINFISLKNFIPINKSDIITNNLLTNKISNIIFIDGVSEELINNKSPIINSWRDGKLEVRNFCNIIECNYSFLNKVQDGFESKKCQIENEKSCDSLIEKEAVLKTEQILHESDYFEGLELENENFAIIANSKNEEAIIFQVKEDRNYLSKKCLNNIRQRELSKK